jgi:quinol monooxygenase YgiN
LTITIYPHRTKRKELLSACHMIANRTLDETGCMDSRVVPGSEPPSAIVFHQHWRGSYLLEDYFRSDHFSALLGAMKLLAVDWEMAINGGTPEKAIEAIKNARGP